MSMSILPRPRQWAARNGQLDVHRLKWRISADAVPGVAIGQKLKELKLKASVDPSLGPWTLAAGDAPISPRRAEYPEGYALSISGSGVAIRGQDAAGLYWGLVTLQQMLEQTKILEACEICDWPAVAVRYHHDDISRKQISRVEDFKRIIGLLSQWKIGHYTIYMEDVLHLKSYPDIGEGRGKLLSEEVREIVEEGRRKNVDVFPTYSLIGHQENLLRLAKYAHLGRKVFQPPSSFDLANPNVRPFLAKVIEDVCELFPSKYFHMGFDETQGLSCDEFIAHANWCAGELVKRGKTPIMWVDMIYNHFGYEQIGRLHPAIVPVNWCYGQTKEIPHQAQLMQQGRDVWGLAGYDTWCRFIPDQRACRGNFAAWIRALVGERQHVNVGLGSSQWGDNGYENLRDLPQNAFAAFGEYAWSGAAADEKTLDARFNRLFYRSEMAGLEAISQALPATASISASKLWRLHRAKISELRRRVVAGELSVADAKRDLAKVEQAIKQLPAIARDARAQKSHLDHYRVGLLRSRSVLQRVIAAGKRRITSGDARRVIAGLELARREYRRLWLEHNKPENIEVSLAVFDRAEQDVREHSARRRLRASPQYCPLKLTYTSSSLDAGGIPVGDAAVNGVPFLFAGEKGTHVELKPGGKMRLRLPPGPVRDLHLIVTGPRNADAQPRPALRVELLHGERSVFQEELLRIRHLCDWWAPFGNHMWAGGGFAYVDPMRVRPAVDAAEYYAMMEVWNFGLTGTPTADWLELTVLDDGPVQVFAITVERPVR